MNYLLDTHTVIWMVEDSPQMPPKVKEIIKDPKNNISICAVSIWEMAIKMNIGKLDLKLTLDDLISELRISDFGYLQIEDDYLRCLSELPLLHKDPFDRLIIATAMVENMTIITIDENIQKYNVMWDW